MKRIVRILIVTAILCAVLFVGSAASSHDKAHACGNILVSASTTRVSLYTFSVSFSLWYDSCNQANFTSAVVISGDISELYVGIHRESGPDGGVKEDGKTCYKLGGTCNSPEIYSPNNLSFSYIKMGDTYILTQAF